MADVRSLLRAELSSRRLSHQHLSYTKSGLLTCAACHLNIKSESLWEGHLKSKNHQRNAQNLSIGNIAGNGNGKSLKRKIEDVSTSSRDEAPDTDGEGRKKTKSVQFSDDVQIVRHSRQDVEGPGDMPGKRPAALLENEMSTSAANSNSTLETEPKSLTPTNLPPTEPVATIDEEEWAAFEREVAPLIQPEGASSTRHNGSTIVAAPISAADLAARADLQSKSRKDTEAEDEKEEESRRMEDEFDVMEEMEDRVRRLREKREALRQGIGVGDSGDREANPETDPPATRKLPSNENDEGDGNEDDDDEGDDWFS